MVVGVAKGPDRDAGREHFFVPGKRALHARAARTRFSTICSACATRRTASPSAPPDAGARCDIDKNPLDEIEGVGPGRKRALLHAFGSARGVARADVPDLVKVEGVSEALAQRIHAYFRKG